MEGPESPPAPGGRGRYDGLEISRHGLGACQDVLGVTMGWLAAAAGLGQTLRSAAGGLLFGALAERSFGWLTLPPVVTLLFLLLRPRWLSATSAGPLVPGLGRQPPSSIRESSDSGARTTER